MEMAMSCFQPCSSLVLSSHIRQPSHLFNPPSTVLEFIFVLKDFSSHVHFAGACRHSAASSRMSNIRTRGGFDDYASATRSLEGIQAPKLKIPTKTFAGLQFPAIPAQTSPMGMGCLPVLRRPVHMGISSTTTLSKAKHLISYSCSMSNVLHCQQYWNKASILAFI